MSVVSNTSPLCYLLLVDALEVLPILYGEVYAPGAVLRELQNPDSPDIVRKWASSPASWLLMRDPARLHPGMHLHTGETYAISLALELQAERLIMDDYAGRDMARSLGVPLVGTIGVLDLAAERGLIDLPVVVKRLTSTTFRIARPLIEEILQRDAARRRKPGDGGST